MAILMRTSNIISSLMLICTSLTLTGCFTDFDPKIDATPVLCLNSNIVAGEPIRLYITRSWVWNEGKPGETISIDVNNAEVKLIVNGDFVERLKYEEIETINYYGTVKDIEKVYTSTYAPAPGDVIRLEAESPEYGGAWAETTVPMPVPITNVEWTRTNFNHFVDFQESYYCDLSFQVSFTDPAGTDNYYQFEADIENLPNWTPDNEDYKHHGYVDMASILFHYEPLFSEHMSALDMALDNYFDYTIFTDRQIEGKTYPLHFVIERMRYIVSDPEVDPEEEDALLHITLRAISKDYYNHVLSIWEANDGVVGSLGSVGLGEMVYTHSNVSTGAGIVAASTPSTVTLRFSQLLQD